jgi:DNA-binding response OmpR family regulator
MRQSARSTRSEARILVVDDDFHSREGLRLSFLREGYVVETARNGWQALQRLKERPVELAIIDLAAVQGVTLNGWDVLRLCRAYNPAICIVVVSAEAGREVRARAEQFDVAVHLEKPVNRIKLKAIVKARLRQLDGVQRRVA